MRISAHSLHLHVHATITDAKNATRHATHVNAINW